jgi:hypothetical protein
MMLWFVAENLPPPPPDDENPLRESQQMSFDEGLHVPCSFILRQKKFKYM